ncbi:MAG TPA: NUDIX hydrolase [Jiangellales bacterium]|nr:NUDIX hydrolase [Jiangellales bacterium]
MRDGASGLEAYVLRRRASMAFAAGMHAFPGGAVDPRDTEHPLGSWAGPSPADWGSRLGCDEAAARGFVCAAVRETFEESGVLLAAAPGDGAAVVDASGPGWEEARQSLVDRRLALTDLLDDRGLVLRSDLLAAWAHWVTPRFEERRYDTWFFLALLPAGQEPRDVSGEADRTAWTRPDDAVSAARAGELAMLPPTWATLEELGGFPSADAAFAAAAGRDLPEVTPGWVDLGGEVRVVVPGDPDFPGDDPGGRP